MRSVVLLRTPKEPLCDDPYHRVFASAGYGIHHVPVLETALLNVDALRSSLLERQQGSPYSGVVVTSQRAVEALAEAKEACEGGITELPPFFVVGAATGKALEAVFEGAQLHGGDNTGSSEKLAHFIPSLLVRQVDEHRLLYLVGDKNSDILPRTLASAGISTSTLQVYETTPRSDTSALLHSALAACAAAEETWVVFFSPSGAKVCWPLLDPDRSFRYAAIGETTSTYIKQHQETELHAVADAPNPTELLKAIVAAGGGLASGRHS